MEKMKLEKWNILGEEVEMYGKEGNMFVNDPKDAFKLCLFAGMKDEKMANRLAKREFLFNVDFQLLQRVQHQIKFNVFQKMEEINFEIDEHVGHTNLHAMAEFDGGHDLVMVEMELFKILTKKADILQDVDAMTEDEIMVFYHKIGAF